jgi:hypothetical protein
MLAIVHDAIDVAPDPFANETRAECNEVAYHEAFEVHGHMVLQVHDALDCPASVNIRITPVSSTGEAVFGVIFL